MAKKRDLEQQSAAVIDSEPESSSKKCRTSSDDEDARFVGEPGPLVEATLKWLQSKNMMLNFIPEQENVVALQGESSSKEVESIIFFNVLYAADLNGVAEEFFLKREGLTYEGIVEKVAEVCEVPVGSFSLNYKGKLGFWCSFKSQLNVEVIKLLATEDTFKVVDLRLNTTNQ